MSNFPHSKCFSSFVSRRVFINVNKRRPFWMFCARLRVLWMRAIHSQQAATRVLLFRSPIHASGLLLGLSDFSLEKSRILGVNYTLNDNLSLSRSRYPISVSEKRNSTPIASSFSHARTHSHVSSERTLAQRSADIFEWGAHQHIEKTWRWKNENGPGQHPEQNFECVCSGVRVWRYRFCRVGPLELVAEGLKINRKAYYDVMGVVGKIAH